MLDSVQSSLHFTVVDVVGILERSQGFGSDGERSEPRSQTPGTSGVASYFVPSPLRTPTPGFLFRSLFAFLACARNKSGIPAQGILVARASSTNLWMASGQSGAQLEPRVPRDPNSNRCLSDGPGHQLACIRMSQNTPVSI